MRLDGVPFKVVRMSEATCGMGTNQNPDVAHPGYAC